MDPIPEMGTIERPGSVLAAGRRLLASVWEQIALTTWASAPLRAMVDVSPIPSA